MSVYNEHQTLEATIYLRIIIGSIRQPHGNRYCTRLVIDTRRVHLVTVNVYYKKAKYL